jgi:putative NADPH-quinone reductase
MMAAQRIVIVDGHPDPDPGRFVHALAESYASGALAAGHEIRRIELAKIDFPLIRTRADWEGGELPAAIREAQDTIAWSDHIVILYPLWLGDVPALLKAFLEQVMRPGFAFGPIEGRLPEKKLKGRSARIVVTMGMPALFYKAFYRAHSLKSLERNILKFVGISPVEHLLLGNVESDADARDGWLRKLVELGETGS